MLTAEQRFSISTIRSISVLLIVSCHILQGYNNPLAWWLNVGVQIFLVMSGFMFGAKEVSNYKEWYKKRFKRILKPYYIYLIIIIPALIMFRNNAITLKQIICYILNFQGIKGSIVSLGHLWYITLIALCYLVTPLLFKYNISKKENSTFKFYSLMIMQFLILQLLFLENSI